MATDGHFCWPPAGNFVAAYGQFFMAANNKCLALLREGDTLVVARLDRLGRSLGNLVQPFQELGEQGIGVRVLDNPMLSTDGNKAQAKLMLGIFGTLAEYERDLLRERTNVGLASARARGRVGGRPPLLDSPRVARAKELHAAGVMNPREIADAVGVSVATLYRYLGKQGSLPAAAPS